MSLLQHNGFRSLRSQLVLSSLLVQVVMLAILVWNSVRITDNALHQLFQDHVDSMVTMMAVSLANPLVQRDYASLDERLGRFLQQDSLVYVVVRDEMGRVAAQRGEVPKKERLDNSFDMPDKIYGQAFDITVAGRVVGRAHYGLDVSLLRATLANLRTQGITVALLAILLTFLLLATIVHLVTHRLRELALAAHAIRSGDYSVRVAVVGWDEVAVTAQTFNSMAETLEHDIHQRKQAEAALKESERRFRTTLENVQLLVVSVDTSGNITYCNDFMLARTGWSREEVIGRHWFTMFLPESGRATVWQMFRQAIASGDLPLHYENEIITRSGETRLIHWNNTLLRDPGGKLLGTVSLGEDITEHKQAEEKLKQSEQRLRNIIDGLSPNMFVGLLSTEGAVLEANQQALAAAGLKLEDVLGKPVEETYWFSYSDDIKQQLRQAVIRAAHGEASRYDVQIRAAENQLIPLDFSIQPFRDAAGKVVLLVPSAVVIIERKLAEAALRESEAKFRTIIESSPVALAVNDQQGNITLLNRKFIETFGYILADIPTLDKWWPLAYPDPAYRQRVAQEWQVAAEKAQRNRTEFEPLEYQVTCADGSVRDILFSMALMDGFSLVILHDITERKRAGEVLRESEERLRLALDAAHMGTFDWDIPKDLITGSRWHEELWGIRPGKFGNTFEVFAQRVYPEDLPGINAEITRCLATRELFTYEWRVVWPDATTHWISCRGEFTFSTDGQPQHMHGVAVEITERKQAEETLQAYSRQLQALSKRVLEVQEAERRHVARELHDELGQILTAIKINLQARNRLNGQSPVEIDCANIGMVEDAIGHVRRLALALRPPMIDDLGLLSALHWAVEQSLARVGLAVQWQSDLADQRLASEIETACFRIAQEAFTNIMRHAQAHSVTIDLRHADDQLLLTVRDDGCGFDVAEMRARATAGVSIGVLGMQERAALAGGQLQIESVPGQGTTIRASFPWRVRVGEV